MNTCKELAIGITLFLIGVFAQPLDQYQLRCRLCNNARTLSDCMKLAICDNRTEECYMEQVITDAFTSQYRGGCRSITQCNGGTAVATGKRDAGIVCSQCCGYANDCNSRLCGIRQDNLASSLCYFCDDMKSTQGSVSRPEDCITFTACDSDQICKLLMRRVFEDMDHCHNNTLHECQHASVLCNVCCGDSGCNYGDCKSITERLYRLHKSGNFNMTTLQTTSRP
ncbi:uncharacterized protein LOC127839315 isoform X2 [Dreissena polymorpha]|uniref:uncharacterized protein LOC127839315 isoform X2 n=1 Tax=Dreissena polymorpha TaxID=45954 RepID=UPI0022642E9E|nr:uncharacterized protein LOC127839315 isoform X2 [Dreissena polymorpha]